MVYQEWERAKEVLDTLGVKKYRALRNIGFTHKEAEPLSRLSFKAPYLKELIKDRRKMLKDSIKDKETKTKFQAKIRNLYFMYEWLNDDNEPYFWAMIRWYEQYGAEKYPDWKTPHPKKRQTKKDKETFSAKWVEDGDKYPTGAAYKKKKDSSAQSNF